MIERLLLVWMVVVRICMWLLELLRVIIVIIVASVDGGCTYLFVVVRTAYGDDRKSVAKVGGCCTHLFVV